ncbi:oxidoreductase [Gemmatimonadetes bacterium T265]|nr:oxidoreductase [Gemmatimonadetes bacterium T265]
MADPTKAGAQPPQPDQQQAPPGTEQELTPRADHGETSYRGSGKLAGKVALITGADSGIGRAVALAFAREGADVLISYLNEADDATETRRLVEAEGRRALTVAGDIADEAHCRTLVRRCVEELGRVDVLVNNAAFQRTHEDIGEFSTKEWDRTYRTNVYAMFWLCREAAPHMRPGSAIINTTSVQAYTPEPMLLAYASTKAAIKNFTQGLAQGVADKGIRVNAVAPGPVWTPLIPATLPADKVKTFGQDTPLKRAAQPRELAPIYVLLASDEGSYLTGMIYGATGGDPIG